MGSIMKPGQLRTVDRRRPPLLPGTGPEFLTDPRRGCSPENITNPDVFYSERAADREQAIRVCVTSCPFLQECDAYAIERGEQWGIWGGRSREPRLAPFNDRKVRQLWRQRLTDEEIAERLGTTVRAVKVSRTRQGLLPTPPTED